MTENLKTSRIFKNTWFGRFTRREKISDKTLVKLINDADNEIVDANLGGNIIKQRIARPGQGKSGGYRTIIVFKKADKAFFVYGFPKSERENIERDELTAFRKEAKELLALSDNQISKLIATEVLTEIKK